jgi:hypothetical protein
MKTPRKKKESGDAPRALFFPARERITILAVGEKKQMTNKEHMNKIRCSIK